ncbi:MAG: OmpH family outer membrane protein [Gammaproteobacteria bacterium]|nr:OmpH family outer membrane protein [Gammaproteobacteria bacterium]
MKIKTTVLSLSAGLFLTANLMAATTVGIVNLTTVFQNVPQGSAALASLKEELSPQVQALQTKQQSLQQQISAFNGNTKLSKKEAATQKAALLQQQTALQKTVQTFQQTATAQEQTLLATFNTNLKAASTSVAKADHVDLVLSNQTTLYSADSVDLTKQVVAAMQQSAATQSGS